MPDATLNFGFVTVLQENGGYVGGYLVTNRWSRPLEFRLTTPVQTTRVQQILYGPTLRPYIYSDLLGKALLEKSSVPVQLIITDQEPLLDLRLHINTPVAWLASDGDSLAQKLGQAGGETLKTPAGTLLTHPKYAHDLQVLREQLEQASGYNDLAEPFTRIREALNEARKAGATSKAA